MLSDYNSIWKAVSLWKWRSLAFQLIFRPGDATLARFPWWLLLSSNSGWLEPEILFPAVFLFFTLSRSINTSEGVSETVQYFLDRLYTNRYQLSWNPVYVITISERSVSHWQRNTQDFHPHVDLPLQCTSWRGSNFDRFDRTLLSIDVVFCAQCIDHQWSTRHGWDNWSDL